MVEASETDRDGSHGPAGSSLTKDVDQGPSYGAMEMMSELPIFGNPSFISHQTCLISWTRDQNENGEDGGHRNECHTIAL